MDAKQQSHGWWFDSHSSLNCSPWLQSTLAELDEKTKTMLKLIEDDSDSFAQRAEMYYKKRPELVSMVEDFYRSHRSLAERYDQLKSDRSLRVRSPLRQSVSHPKDEYDNDNDNMCDSLKSLESFSEVAYSSDDESVDSEVDDPELEGGKERAFSSLDSGNDEMTKLREELYRLREENEIQKSQLIGNNQEKDELFSQLADNINELKKLREECEAIKEEGPFNPSEFPIQKDGDRIYVTKKFEAMQKLGELEAENRYFKDALVLKEILLKHEEEEKTKVRALLEETKIELIKLREETREKDEWLIEALEEKDEQKREVIRQLSLAMEILREDNKVLKKSIMKYLPKKGNCSWFWMFN
ncbi:uncharacterized protein LOC141598488 [Silene latifolia]|uniref:uncharacterized protein LOC141598488 n=1 Tax=Silene latifolia TaxID=37657 RepID=UPI003D7747CA